MLNFNIKNTAREWYRKYEELMRLVRTGPIHIEGFLNDNPELRYTPSGNSITNFLVIGIDGITYHCELWKDETLAQHGIKGMPIIIDGNWGERKWKDADNETHRYSYVNVHEWSKNV